MNPYADDLFEHCKFLNCYTCDDMVLERHSQRAIKHSHLNALYELAYHMKKGRVRVPVTLMTRLFETDNVVKAVYLLSRLAKNPITVFDEKDFLVLEIAEKENA